MAEDLKYIIESLLFVSETPLTMDHLKGIIEGEETAAIRTALDELMAEYEQRDGGFVLKQVAGGYQLRSQGRYNEWIKRLIKPSTPRLSKAALETLAIIAYNQPIIRSDIEHIRGVDSGGVIRMLMERKLIRVLGRKEIPGRPLIYATTKHFLEVFELKDLKDLPTPREIEELSRSRLEEQTNVDDHAEDHPLASPLPAETPEADNHFDNQD
ncbi:SMC-Scp complex subunit ScpB [Desulfosarcina sp.]|uniref:SMC-Scp complex subunit ScpB n=1 Tax=Desulfosarcina sp. TaxID=2027861 RepID=UPI0035675485